MSDRRERITLDCPVGTSRQDREELLRVAQSFAVQFIDRKPRDPAVYLVGHQKHGVCWWTKSRAIVARLEAPDA